MPAGGSPHRRAEIFGLEPEIMAEAAPLALALSGADILDINMGCPVGKVVRSGDGSALMRDPELAGRIIEAVVKAVDVPVTVKFRQALGRRQCQRRGVCPASGAGGRLRHRRARPHARRCICRARGLGCHRDVKKAVSVPVLANGDVFTGADAAHILRYTGCDGVMIGRGCFGDPWLFARANAALAGEPEPERPPLRERIQAAVEQSASLLSRRGSAGLSGGQKPGFTDILEGVPHAGPYKKEIVQVSTIEELEHVARMIQMNLRDSKEQA